MTEKTFINSVSNSKIDVIQLLLDILAKTQSDYCLIGGLAVNAYAEPVVSLDLDIVILSANIGAYLDQTRRPSKRQKDLADIMRLREVNHELTEKIPLSILQKL